MGHDLPCFMRCQQQSWEQGDQGLISAGPCLLLQASDLGKASWLSQVLMVKEPTQHTLLAALQIKSR